LQQKKYHDYQDFIRFVAKLNWKKIKSEFIIPLQVHGWQGSWSFCQRSAFSSSPGIQA